MDDNRFYENPLVTRYASPQMAELWGAEKKFRTWRQLWVALAEAQSELGLLTDDGSRPRISPGQLEELRRHVDDVDFSRASFHERQMRHDVMAHIATYAEACPQARDIIHLGATSCFVTDNTDLLLMRRGLELLRDRLVGVIGGLGKFAAQYRSVPAVGYTHFQPAQLTTVGKRACLWCYEFVLDLHEMEHRLGSIRFRGAKGTTGTQGSFLKLFKGDHEKVRELDRLVSRKMGFDATYSVTGQTYSRKVDSQILDTLSGVGQSAHKFGCDLRLLSHLQEIEEPFEADQVGSTAMPYKRNPMRAERMCGLARFVSTLPVSAAQTAANQWLERTLDDSVNRRLTLPQSFLGTDSILRLALNIVYGLRVNREVIARHVDEVLPYIATENILMTAVTHGKDRQFLHEVIRKHSTAVSDALKAGATKNDLISRLEADPEFLGISFEEIIRPDRFVGRAPEQVQEFIAAEIEPLKERFPNLMGQSSEVQI